MEPNNNTKVVAGVLGAIAVLLILGGFYYSFKMNKEEKVFDPNIESSRGIEENVQTVDVKHQYKNGIHTYAGEINLPTPCDAVEVKATKDTMDVNRIVLAFTTTSVGEACAQVIAPRKFKVTVEAPENVATLGTLNGSSIRINLFDVPESEDLDSFEVNVKG